MNTAIALLVTAIGVIISCIGISRLANLPVPEKKETELAAREETPEHGDYRIIEDSSGTIWIQQYAQFPGWMYKKTCKSVEEAREEKKRWDDIRTNKSIKEFKIHD